MRVSVLVVDGAFDSGLACVSDVFAAANLLRAEIDRPPAAWRVTLVGTRRHLHTAAGHRVTTVPAASLPEPPDLLMVPALGLGTPPALLTKARSLTAAGKLITAAAGNGVELAAACSGTLLLAGTGVLDDREATTSWWLGPLFRAHFPAVRLDPGATLVTADGVCTAGAAFAHIDLALSIVRRRSPALADLVARYLLIGERASQATYAIPELMARDRPDMRAFERWVRGRLPEPIRIADAAAALGLSERTLQRVTRAAMGLSPLDFVSEVRLDEAAHLLRTTDLSVDAVAGRVGFANAATLRALARRRRGATLRELRGRRP